MEQLTEGYQKARRMLALFSALLLVREYLGIDLERDAAGESATLGLPAVDANLKVANPEALPLVLVALVVYFTYRVVNEWKHSDVERRRTKAAQVDLWVTLALAMLGVGLFIYQSASGVQLAATPRVLMDFVAGAASSAAVLFSVLQLESWRVNGRHFIHSWITVVSALLAVAVLAAAFFPWGPSWTALGAGGAVGLGFSAWFLLRVRSA